MYIFDNPELPEGTYWATLFGKSLIGNILALLCDKLTAQNSFNWKLKMFDLSNNSDATAEIISF